MGKLIDLTGRTFGRITVISQAPKRKGVRGRIWNCRCSCGTEKQIPGRYLLGGTMSCGCLNRESVSERNTKDLTGRTFGRLTVLCKLDVRSSSGEVRWQCRCSCGNVVEVQSHNLLDGHSKSCGCLCREHILDVTEKWKTPDEKRLATVVFHAMKKRCYDSSSQGFKNYGCRGIVICDEWLNSTRAFVDWALRAGYRRGLTIDRINNDGNYSPENCRWVTRVVQQNNRRTNMVIEVDGVRKTATEWARKIGIPADRIYYKVRNKCNVEAYIRGKLGTSC